MPQVVSQSVTADTIAAIASATGKGAIGIVKVSGVNTQLIAKAILGKKLLPKQASYTAFLDSQGRPLDHGVALFFKGPESYTGEDVLELQSHGNPILLDQLLDVAIQNGARAARPGEFTERAFLNDKIDLAQAEAVSDLIEASTTEAACAAVRSMQGEFSKHVRDITRQLIDCRVYIESALDFAEEEIDFLKETELEERFNDLETRISNLLLRSQEGALLRDGLNIVIAGLPNVGKSSLLNRLAGYDVAIVTDIAGTTRDVLKEKINIDGMPIHVVDTAGLRDSEDPIELEGVKRARDQLTQADRILFVVEAGKQADPQLISDLPSQVPVSFVVNKSDLIETANADADQIIVSAKTGQGLDTLREHLKACAGFEKTNEGALMARRRHIDALEKSKRHVASAKQNIQAQGAGELAAEELRLAQEQVNMITGQFTSDDLLGEIFSRFCIGK